MKKIFYLLVLLVAFSGIVYAVPETEYNLVGEVHADELVPANPNIQIATLIGDFGAEIGLNDQQTGQVLRSTGNVQAVGRDVRGKHFSIRLNWNTDRGALNIVRNDDQRIIFETTGTQLLVDGTRRLPYRENLLVRVAYDIPTNEVTVRTARFSFVDMLSFTS